MGPLQPSVFLPALGALYALGSFAYLFTSLSGSTPFLGGVVGGCLFVLPILTLFALLVGWLVGCRFRWWAILLFLSWMAAVGYAQLVILAEASAAV